MNVNPALLPAALTPPALGGGTPTLATAAAPLAATTLRDAAIPDLAATTASANSLQTLATMLAGQSPNASLLGSSASSAAASASAVAIPAPPLPSAVDHGSHDESPVHEDLGLDDPGADPSQASISA
jgi:hypothetical protein